MNGSSSDEAAYDEPLSAHAPHFAVPDAVSNCDGITLGVLSGLHEKVAKITELRDQVRDRKRKGLQLSVDDRMISKGLE